MIFFRSEWAGKVFDVIDTGGLVFDEKAQNVFANQIREQVSGTVVVVWWWW